jgi:hypothetical protein
MKWLAVRSYGGAGNVILATTDLKRFSRFSLGASPIFHSLTAPRRTLRSTKN